MSGVTMFLAAVGVLTIGLALDLVIAWAADRLAQQEIDNDR